MSAYPEGKLDAHLGKRNSGTPCGVQSEPCNGRLSCLSWVRCESHAQFFGGGVMVTSSRYPTIYESNDTYANRARAVCSLPTVCVALLPLTRPGRQGIGAVPALPIL